MKNAYLQKRELERETWIHTAERLTEQFMTDTLQMTLHEHYGFGYDRIMELMERWREMLQEYRPALNSKNAECDVKQEHMDRAMLQILRGKADLIPFEERYPELRKVRY